jgi:hypothetical protein
MFTNSVCIFVPPQHVNIDEEAEEEWKLRVAVYIYVWNKILISSLYNKMNDIYIYEM